MQRKILYLGMLLALALLTAAPISAADPWCIDGYDLTVCWGG